MRQPTANTSLTLLPIFTVLRTTARLFINPCSSLKNCMVIRKSVQFLEERYGCSETHAVFRRTVRLLEILSGCSNSRAVVRNSVQLFEELCSCSKFRTVVRTTVQLFEIPSSSSKNCTDI